MLQKAEIVSASTCNKKAQSPFRSNFLLLRAHLVMLRPTAAFKLWLIGVAFLETDAFLNAPTESLHIIGCLFYLKARIAAQTLPCYL